MRDDLQIFSVVQMDRDAVENRAAHLIHRQAGDDRINSHHGKNDKGGNAAAIFITGNAERCIGEPIFQQFAHPFLRFPRRAEMVVDVRNREARFVAHHELAD